LFVKLYTNPSEILGMRDNSFDNTRYHDVKKPQNMVSNFPYIGLLDKELVAAMALGSYDKLTYFKPMRMTFYIDRSKNEII
jgi:hypothetical protein